MQIQRVAVPDQILYQTERYHNGDFGYSIPLKEDGDYVLVLKFSEVWFNTPNQKVSCVFYGFMLQQNKMASLLTMRKLRIVSVV